MRLAILASGRGSNLLAILEAIARGELDATVVGVFSDRRAAPALVHARNAGIRAQSLAPREFASRTDFDEHLFSLVDAVQPDLIVCAGYMRLISDPAVAARTGRMINIHPSLLPEFKGLRTHQQALDAGASVHGASVHFVTSELDGGPVITQVRVPVERGDDAATLAERVLQREHPLLVATLRELAGGRIAWIDHGVHFNGHPLAAPLQLDAGNRLVQEPTA
ncbi:phosphoribosylglycinamide formyltransferase-1 [Lysobacter niabensis]|uniref:Phosphoribosylglycinamide formyltransferase n=1 Tax=Agrilutibacter niabensis TaxID=380628 RepID=A0ABU1VKJ0_9GAMM|nr:phosphoribosylglycinamide formyltransferase [Lysobacter niabensis]MDR7097996.1 phosphoribosylglycinamide formyltransferase-1 [Lysobacter niabensis]